MFVAELLTREELYKEIKVLINGIKVKKCVDEYIGKLDNLVDKLKEDDKIWNEQKLLFMDNKVNMKSAIEKLQAKYELKELEYQQTIDELNNLNTDIKKLRKITGVHL